MVHNTNTPLFKEFAKFKRKNRGEYLYISRVSAKEGDVGEASPKGPNFPSPKLVNFPPRLYMNFLYCKSEFTTDQV